MSAERHRRKRDVPHRTRHFGTKGEGKRFNGRVQMEDGKSFPAHGVGDERGPRRPPISMLFEDLAPPPGVFGMYPPSLIGKIVPWLKCGRSEILHVCSGGLPIGEGIRVDIRPEARPDVVADGRKLPFATGSIAGVMLDPPYSEHYAKELYGTSYPRPSHLLAEAARVVRPGGRIAFVHYIVPNPPPNCIFIRAFGLSMGFGYPMRAVSIYERAQAELEIGSSA